MELVNFLMIFVHLIVEEILKVMQKKLPEGTGTKVRNSGSHTTFLDLHITISNGKTSTKLYDKRDHLSFLSF